MKMSYYFQERQEYFELDTQYQLITITDGYEKKHKHTQLSSALVRTLTPHVELHGCDMRKSTPVYITGT